jgi:hypothetical protein
MKNLISRSSILYLRAAYAYIQRRSIATYSSYKRLTGLYSIYLNLPTNRTHWPTGQVKNVTTTYVKRIYYILQTQTCKSKINPQKVSST